MMIPILLSIAQGPSVPELAPMDHLSLGAGSTDENSLTDDVDINAPIGTFLDSLNLTSAQLHALHHIPMTFFYLHAR